MSTILNTDNGTYDLSKKESVYAYFCQNFGLKGDDLSLLERFILNEPKKLEAENENLKYIHAMKLAAISSVSFANTKEAMSLIKIDKSSEFWSPAFNDVKDSVYREIILLKKLEVAKKALELAASNVVWFQDSAGGSQVLVTYGYFVEHCQLALKEIGE